MEIRVKDAHVQWMLDNYDNVHGEPGQGNTFEFDAENKSFYPFGAYKIVPKDELDYEEELKIREMWKHAVAQPLEGVILGDNAELNYPEEDFAYLVWVANDFGSQVMYLDKENFERI